MNAIGQSKIETTNPQKKVIRDGGKLVHCEVKKNNVSSRKYFSSRKEYYWYKSQKVIITKGAASGSLLSGVYEVFYENGQFCEKGRFINGLKNGEWRYWNQEGDLILKEKWIFGKKQIKKKKATQNENIE